MLALHLAHGATDDAGTDFLKPLKLGSNVAEKLVAGLSEPFPNSRHDLLNGKQLGTAGCYRNKLLA